MEHRDGLWCSIDRQGGGAVERSNQRTSVRWSAPCACPAAAHQAREGEAACREAGERMPCGGAGVGLGDWVQGGEALDAVDDRGGCSICATEGLTGRPVVRHSHEYDQHAVVG